MNNSPRSCIRAKYVVLPLTAFLFCLPLQSQQGGDDPRLEQAHQQNKSLPQYNRPGESLRERLSSSGKSSITVYEFADRGGNTGTLPPNEEDVLRNQICRADAVVLGTILSSVGLLSSNETQVLTDYVVSPTEILKNNPKMPITAGNPFVLTRPGGEVHLDIGNIRQNDSDFSDLSAGKSPYLLFLTEISASQVYRSLDSFSTYLIRNDKAQLIVNSPRGETQRRVSFLSTLAWPGLRALITSSAASCPAQ